MTVPPLPPEQPELFPAGERMCAIWTAQFGYRGPNRLDVTRKGGSPLGPSWPLLIEARGITREGDARWKWYRPRYLEEMAESQIGHRDYWLSILQRRSIVLVCYCRDPERCHRSLLAELLLGFGEANELRAQYCGETR
jgi:hypothetical protein